MTFQSVGERVRQRGLAVMVSLLLGMILGAVAMGLWNYREMDKARLLGGLIHGNAVYDLHERALQPAK